MKELQTILNGINATIANKMPNIKIGVGVERGKFHINKIEFGEKRKTTVTTLHTCDNMKDAVIYLNENKESLISQY